MKKKNKMKKDTTFRSIEELKVKLFPEAVKKEATERVKDQFGMVGAKWANDPIDEILASK